MEENEESNESAQDIIDSSTKDVIENKEEEVKEFSESQKGLETDDDTEEERENIEEKIKENIEDIKEMKEPAKETVFSSLKNELNARKALRQIKKNQKDKEIEKGNKEKQMMILKRQLTSNEKVLKGPSKATVLGTHVGAFLGFTREGVVGKQKSQQNIDVHGNKIISFNNTIKNLNRIKELKIKQAKEDGNISPTEMTDINKLVKKIGQLEKKSNIEKNIYSKLLTEQKIDKGFKYMSPALAKKAGITQNQAIVNSKGRTIGKAVGPFGFSIKGPKKTFLKGKKNKYVTKFEREIGKIKADKIQQADLVDEDIQQIKKTTKPRNEFGVDDWVMNL